jgi:hypothetical protein
VHIPIRTLKGQGEEAEPGVAAGCPKHSHCLLALRSRAHLHLQQAGTWQCFLEELPSGLIRNSVHRTRTSVQIPSNTTNECSDLPNKCSGIMNRVPGTRYSYLLPGTCYRYLVPGTWYLVPSAWFLAPGTAAEQAFRCSEHHTPNAEHSVSPGSNASSSFKIFMVSANQTCLILQFSQGIWYYRKALTTALPHYRTAGRVPKTIENHPNPQDACSKTITFVLALPHCRQGA